MQTHDEKAFRAPIFKIKKRKASDQSDPLSISEENDKRFKSLRSASSDGEHVIENAISNDAKAQGKAESTFDFLEVLDQMAMPGQADTLLTEPEASKY